MIAKPIAAKIICPIVQKLSTRSGLLVIPEVSKVIAMVEPTPIPVINRTPPNIQGSVINAEIILQIIIVIREVIKTVRQLILLIQYKAGNVANPAPLNSAKIILPAA